MGSYWTRLLSCERRTERYLRMILDLKRQVAALQQQLRDLRGT
jgi:hypothetical protein